MSSDHHQAQQQPSDFTWMWTIFACAVGAGILYLPITAGIRGIWPLIAMGVLVIPMIYLSHRALSRFVLTATPGTTNINDVIYEHYSEKFCKSFAFFYFLIVYPIILIYSLGLTNTIESFLASNFDITNIPRSLLAFILLFIVFIVVSTSPRFIRRVAQSMALPLAACLFLLSLYFIQYWKLSSFSLVPDTADFLKTLFIALPVLVFTFNHSSIISTFTLHYKRHAQNPAEDTQRVLLKSTLLIFAFTMFFVFSCVMCIEPAMMEQARAENTNILVFMGEHLNNPVLSVISPLIAIIAMLGACFGNFFGAKEAVIGLIEQQLDIHKVKSKNLDFIATLLVLLPCYIVTVLNININNIISVISGPIMSLFLFIFPMYSIYKIQELRKYHQTFKDKAINAFILAIGILACSAILYSFKDLIFFFD